MRRLLGLLLIVRALSPVLAILVIAWGVSAMIGGLQVALEQPVATIRDQVEVLETQIDTVKTEFDELKGNITTAVTALQSFRIPNILPTIPDFITFPRISIPDFDINIPTGVRVTWTNATAGVQRWVDGACREVVTWLPWPLDSIVEVVCDAGRWVTDTISFQYPSDLSFSYSSFRINFPSLPRLQIPMPAFIDDLAAELRGLFSGFDDIFNLFDSAFTEIRALGDSLNVLPERFSFALGEGRALINGVKEVLQKWSAVLLIALGIILILVVIYYVLPFIDDFMRGWRMLFGPAPRS